MATMEACSAAATSTYGLLGTGCPEVGQRYLCRFFFVVPLTTVEDVMDDRLERELPFLG